MSREGVVLLALALVLSAGGTLATAVIGPSGIDPRLRLEWEAGQTRGGRGVIDRAFGFVPGIVRVFSRSYFDVPLKTSGASYRIAVTSFEWLER